MTGYLVVLSILIVVLVVDVSTDLYLRERTMPQSQNFRPDSQFGFSQEEYDAYMGGNDFEEWVEDMNERFENDR